MINVTYTASDGTVYNLMASMAMRLKTANFHQSDWKATTTSRKYGVRVNGWNKEAKSFNMSILFRGTKARRVSALNRFHASIDRDIIYNTPGVLAWGDWHITAFIYSTSTYPSDKEDLETINDVTVLCPSPFWVSEQTVIVDPAGDTSLRPTDIQFNPSYTYPYSYPRSAEYPRIYIDHYAPCDFRAKIYGPVSSVHLQIGNADLSVSKAVPAGAYMIIDTREHLKPEEHCYMVFGSTVTNCFNDRDPSASLLEKLEPGFARIRYDRTTRLELTIYKERSEPEWTV